MYKNIPIKHTHTHIIYNMCVKIHSKQHLKPSKGTFYKTMFGMMCRIGFIGASTMSFLALQQKVNLTKYRSTMTAKRPVKPIGNMTKLQYANTAK
jgi:hypothetical protein